MTKPTNDKTAESMKSATTERAPGGSAEESPIATDELEALRKQAAQAQEHWDRLLRTTAEFENFRKRAARDKEDAVRYANHALLERLLPVLDSFDMAVAAAETATTDPGQSLKDGIKLVLQQFKTILKEAGLEEIEAHGKPFDPNFHEAVSHLETAEVQDGHVAQQLRKGYLLRDRLVRPSTVVVARNPAA
jgi:molecular chaperone GrpE